MKSYFSFSLVFLSILFVCGCETINGNAGRQQYVRMRESARAQEEQISRFSAKVAALQDDNAELIRRINELYQKISIIQQNNQILEKDLALLKQQVAAEKQERQAAINQMINQVARETASAINATIRSSEGSSAKTGPVGSGEFYEHKVGAGETLSVIGKAYGVTVLDIKKANSLQGDIIRVGQTLYIPRKK